MIRGTRTFICDDCHHIFRALDIEWRATSLSQPMPCPKCGSMHTYTGIFYRGIYKKIWKGMERK